MSGQSRPVSRLSLQTTPAGSICRDRSPGKQLERRREVALQRVMESWSLRGEMENSVAVHIGPGASMDVCVRAKTPAARTAWKARELNQVEKPTNSIGTPFDSYAASLPHETSHPAHLPQGLPGVGRREGGPLFWPVCGCASLCPHGEVVAHERPICSIWQQILYQGTPCARREGRGGPFVTDVLPIPPFFPLSLRPAPVSSPHRGRHVNSSSVLECFIVVVLGRSFQNRPARTPPHPLPFPSTGKSHPRRSIFLLRASFSPAHTPLSHCVFPHLTRLSLSSAPAQLSSGSSTLTLSQSHTHSLALALAHQQHILTVGGTARQDRQALFIHSSCCMGVVCVPVLYKMHTPTHTHTHTYTLHVHE